MMSARWGFIGLVLAAGFAVADESRVADGAQASVVSRSEQFRISGGNAIGRGVAAILAEQAKDDFLDLLDEEDQWKLPVSIVLHGQVGDPMPRRTIATRLWVVGGMQQLQLNKHLSPGIEPERFKQAVVAMLVYARTLRAQENEVGDQAMQVPPWLEVGLREASAWHAQQSDRALYATLFKQGGLFQLGQLLDLSVQAYEEMDGATRAAFRVSSGSLVMALLEQPQGKQGFLDFLDQVALYQGEMPILLRQHFPELNLSDNSLAKWWSLQLANKGDLNLLTDVMGIAETEDQLAKALFLSLPEEDGSQGQVGIEAWPSLAELSAPERMQSIKPAQLALVRLSYRCFPSYRPLILEYQKLLIRMVQKQTDALAPSLEELREAREIMVAKATRGRDYLDWFEITRARETSGAFQDYLKLKEDLKTQKRQRGDSISAYLDRLNEAFDRDAE